MRRLLILLLLLTQTACAGGFELRMVKQYKDIDMEFKPYIEEFIYVSKGKITAKNFDGFTMGFRDFKKDDSTVGMCHYGANEVDISRSWWNNTYSSSEKIELVFHELGHCILKRGHTKKPSHKGFVAWLERIGFKLGLFAERGYLPDGCPASFMHPYTLSDRCINKHFNYYTNELFGRYEKTNYVELRSTYRKPDSIQQRCEKPEVINHTDTWNEKDQKTLIRANNRCLELYDTCLKTFYKKTQDSYAAICR